MNEDIEIVKFSRDKKNEKNEKIVDTKKLFRILIIITISIMLFIVLFYIIFLSPSRLLKRTIKKFESSVDNIVVNLDKNLSSILLDGSIDFTTVPSESVNPRSERLKSLNLTYQLAIDDNNKIGALFSTFKIARKDYNLQYYLDKGRSYLYSTSLTPIPLKDDADSEYKEFVINKGSSYTSIAPDLIDIIKKNIDTSRSKSSVIFDDEDISGMLLKQEYSVEPMEYGNIRYDIYNYFANNDVLANLFKKDNQSLSEVKNELYKLRDNYNYIDDINCELYTSLAGKLKKFIYRRGNDSLIYINDKDKISIEYNLYNYDVVIDLIHFYYDKSSESYEFSRTNFDENSEKSSYFSIKTDVDKDSYDTKDSKARHTRSIVEMTDDTLDKNNRYAFTINNITNYGAKVEEFREKDKAFFIEELSRDEINALYSNIEFLKNNINVDAFQIIAKLVFKDRIEIVNR